LARGEIVPSAGDELSPDILVEIVFILKITQEETGFYPRVESSVENDRRAVVQNLTAPGFMHVIVTTGSKDYRGTSLVVTTGAWHWQVCWFASSRCQDPGGIENFPWHEPEALKRREILRSSGPYFAVFKVQGSDKYPTIHLAM